MKPQLKAFRLHPSAVLPKYATDRAACFDICACIVPELEIKFYHSYDNSVHVWQGNNRPDYRNKLDLWPEYRYLVPTGLILDIPENYSVRFHPRSGLSLKQGIVLHNCEGIVDEDYIDPVYVILHNTSKINITINNGDRICQAELVEDCRADILEIGERPVPKSNRNGGFGSTGL